MTDRHAAQAKGSRLIAVPRRVTGAVSVLALAGALWVGFRPIGAVPPIGSLLDPAHGVWAAARFAELPGEQSLVLDGLTGPVEVRFDDRGVPHIFATSVPDVARALGWVHARDRLFQMELTARKVTGTLSELAGRPTLSIDRQSRERGLAVAAEARWNALPVDSPTRKVIEAYVEGINQWVRDADVAEWPVEYKLLGARPRIFQSRDVYYLLAEMGQVLAWQSEELERSAVEALVGVAATDALFPVNAPIQEPIEPVPGRTKPRWAVVRFPAPALPDARAVASASRLGATIARLSPETFTRGEAVVGSNNWAVAPERTAAKHALLSGDPHLQLSLPSVWYEAHLVVPGELDAYGVTFPLAPNIPIGFNRDVAWTATNTGADVMDFYRETVDDSASPTRYRVDGEWRAVTRRVEEFRGRNGERLATDTVYGTHRGPMLRTAEGWLSMRWTVLEPSDEASAFLGAMRARSAEEWYRAMESYKAPAQNFLVADRSGAIGIRSTGRYPIRPGDGRGDRIFDGSTSASDWVGDWPLAQYPQALRPAQGYLASANQQPLDPAVRPGYLGWDWPTPWRAMRINEILRGDSAMTPEKMRLAHTDPRSVMTEPVRSVARAAVTAAGAVASAEEREAMAFLEAWDARFDTESKGAALFAELVQELTKRTWDEFSVPGESLRVATPNTMQLVRLFDDPGSAWWDDRSTTAERETRDAIVRASLRAAWTTMRERRGDDASRWRWGDLRQANIRHLLQLPGFGRESLEVQSGPGTLSPNEGRGTNGASWRFVVELGDAVTAWGTYPGGQSGNPVSSRYDDRLELWRTGQLAPLRLPYKAEDLAGDQLVSVLRFTPMGGAR
ncbi:MAG: penicillin acylase family protein [Gemmatimonadaceae bacterium]|jgi:penicillin amidase|nr:penicillin acylase family protein [Gemmatimonadaceae bacterium]